MKEGNFVEGKGHILHFKEGEKIKKYETELQLNISKNLSEGVLIEEGVFYFVQFKNQKEIPNSRKLKYGGARIMIVGVQEVGKVI